MPELSFYERQHIQKILAQQGSIGNIFNAFAREISGHLRKWTDTGKPNVWVRNAGVEKSIDRALIDLQKNLLNNISSFGMDAWKRSQVKNDDMVKQYIEGMSIRSTVKDGMFHRNMEALKSFQNRIDREMTLSDRVWNIVDITKDQVELYLGSGLSVGRAAGEISSDVRQLLKKPDKRFRRVRDKNGKLQLSAPMKDYNPGHGVYRSSYMNALRLSATNTNINFRQADHDRWRNLDFVLGIEVKRSASNHGPCKICDAMKGKYPKDFVFTGWHPFCICFSIPIMMDHEEFADFLLDEKIPKGKIITSLPPKAEKFIRDNKEQFSQTKPYWYKDNFVGSTRLQTFIAESENVQESSFVELINRAKRLGIDTKRFEVGIEGKYSDLIKVSLEKEIERIERTTIEREEAERKLYALITKTEDEIRMNKSFETSVVFDKNGNILVDKRGEFSSVSFTSEECKKMKDAVITHNHPSGWSYPQKSIRRIGNSLSENDILMAVRWDLSEMRAVTPNYTFVLKRPEKGWGVTPHDLREVYKSINKLIREEGDAYVDKMGYSESSCDRAGIVHFHKLNKRLAKLFGWEYSKYRN